MYSDSSTTSTALAQLALGSRDIAAYTNGGEVTATSAPRPYFHPVQTFSGVTVTDTHPDDHDWHLGAGVAVQDVGGNNLWGGRTYVRDQGYTWLEDHGQIEHLDWDERNEAGFTERLRWMAHDESVLLYENRRVQADRISDAAWRMAFEFELSAPSSAVTLGSPGSNGRENGGYGGFFWRIAPCSGIKVWNAESTGEERTHGKASRFLAWSAAGETGDFTLIFQDKSDAAEKDPWFVRAEGYPGVGSAIAWDSPTLVKPGEPLRRKFAVTVCDGRLGRPEISELVS